MVLGVCAPAHTLHQGLAWGACPCSCSCGGAHAAAEYTSIHHTRARGRADTEPEPEPGAVRLLGLLLDTPYCGSQGTVASSTEHRASNGCGFTGAPCYKSALSGTTHDTRRQLDLLLDTRCRLCTAFRPHPGKRAHGRHGFGRAVSYSHADHPSVYHPSHGGVPTATCICSFRFKFSTSVFTCHAMCTLSSGKRPPASGRVWSRPHDRQGTMEG